MNSQNSEKNTLDVGCVSGKENFCQLSSNILRYESKIEDYENEYKS